MSATGQTPAVEGVVAITATEAIAGIPFEMWLVCHRELHPSRHPRIVSDHLAASL